MEQDLFTKGYGIMPSVYMFAFVTFYSSLIPIGFPKLIGALTALISPSLDL